MKRRIYTLLIAIASAIAVHGFTVEGIEYRTNGRSAEVLGLTDKSYSGELIIPESVIYNGKTYIVTEIENEAFMDCAGLTSVTLPNTITYILGGAFRGCTELTSIDMGNSVMFIGDNAFEDCSSLTSFTIPNSIKYVRSYAFRNTAWYNNLPDGLVYKDNVLYGYKENRPEGHLDIAYGTRVVAADAFRYCFDLTSVNIPNTVVTIDRDAFFQTHITSLYIPASVENIVFEAFSCSSQLKEITVDGSNKIFDSRNSSNAIIETETNTLILGCRNTVIPSGITKIGEEAFRGQYMVNHITLPSTITSIGTMAFAECPANIYSMAAEPPTADGYTGFARTFEGSSTLYVPSGSKAKYEAADGWNQIQTIIEGDLAQTTEEGVEMTYVKTGLNPKTCLIAYVDANIQGKLSIPEALDGYAVTAIGPMALFNCTGLSEISIPNTVKNIGKSAFASTGLTKLSLGESVEEIGEYAFSQCNSLTTVSLPNSVTTIGKSAFTLCSELTAVTIGSSVNSIGEYAFSNCKNIKKVTSLIEEPFEIPFTSFQIYINNENVFSDATLYVPVGTKVKYESTEGWKKFKNIVEGEPVELDPIEGETTVSTEGLSNENLTDNVVNNVYYNVGTNGYDSTDCSIVISETTNMGQIGDKEPGSEDVKQNFTGLILKVGDGKGTIAVNVKTEGNAQLVVQVGNGTPMIASKTEKGDVVASYNVTEDTYVYIYAIIGSSTAPARRAASADAVKIYAVTVTPGATGIASVQSSKSGAQNYYALDGRKLNEEPTKKGIYIQNGRKVVMK